MLKRFLMYVSTKAGRRDSEKILEWLKCLTDGEVSASLCCASMARAWCGETKLLRGKFPEAEFRGEAPLDRAAAGRISLYNMELVQVHKRLQNIPGDASEFTATGLTILIPSLRALADPELFAGGRQLWNELKRGTSGWSEHLEIIAPHVAFDPQKLAELWLFPNALAPDTSPWTR